MSKAIKMFEVTFQSGKKKYYPLSDPPAFIESSHEGGFVTNFEIVTVIPMKVKPCAPTAPSPISAYYTPVAYRSDCDTAQVSPESLQSPDIPTVDFR